MTRMAVRRDPHTGEWYIHNVPDTVDVVGPYDTRREAAEDKQGLVRFFRKEINRRPPRSQRADPQQKPSRSSRSSVQQELFA